MIRHHDGRRHRPGDRRSRPGTAVVCLVTLLTAATAAAVRGEAVATGPLRVHPGNPRYFADASGRAVLLAGSHTWPNLVDIGPSEPPPAFDFDAYLEFLVGHGHTMTRGWAWEPTRWHTSRMKNPSWRNADHVVGPHPWRRTGPGTAADGRPRFDLTRHDPAYLERLDTRLTKAAARGIYMSVMLFEGYGVQFNTEAWAHHPFNPANNVNGIDGDADADGRGIEVHQLAVPAVTQVQEAYVRWLVEALNHHDNLLWEISNETHPDSTAFQEHVIRFIKTCEAGLPKRHPVGMTYQNRRGRNETLFAGPADWVSPNAAGGFRDDPPDLEGRKVVLADTDHLWGIGGDVTWVWKTVTRGGNPLFMDPYDGAVLATRDDARYDPVRRTLGRAVELSRRIDLAASRPAGDLSATGYCLADPGRSYLVFAPEGGPFDLDLSAAPTRCDTLWLDPRTDAVTSGDPLVGGGRVAFRPPFVGPAVLLVTAVAAGSAAPAAPGLVVAATSDRVVVRDAVGAAAATFAFEAPGVGRPAVLDLAAPGGVVVTRPCPPRPGVDDDDHAAMHPGLWLGFSDLSGADPWRRKTAVRFAGLVGEPVAIAEGVRFTARIDYLAGPVDTPDAAVVCRERSTLTVRDLELAGHPVRLVVWAAELSPGGAAPLVFGDVEEMGLGVRLARGLAPARGGRYVASHGGRDEAGVFGRAADWVDASGTIDGREVGVMVVDLPGNPRAPFFHARDYGLLLANPFGRRAYGSRTEAAPLAVPPGKSLRLSYAVVVHAAVPAAALAAVAEAAAAAAARP